MVVLVFGMVKHWKVACVPQVEPVHEKPGRQAQAVSEMAILKELSTLLQSIPWQHTCTPRKKIQAKVINLAFIYYFYDCP